nr:MAG TPA: hypothetical protein [Caudoviricetes sp.]
MASAGDLVGLLTILAHVSALPRSSDTLRRLAPRAPTISLIHVLTCMFAPFVALLPLYARVYVRSPRTTGIAQI